MTLHHPQNLRPGWRPRTATEVLSELDATHARLGLVDGVCEGCGLTAVLEDRRRRGRGVPPGPMDAAQALAWLGLPPVVSEEAAEAGKDAAGLPIPAFTFGVNTVAFGTEERFGTTTDLVEDLERLGVTVARHPGGAQLFLEHLLPTSDAYGDIPPRGRLKPITPDKLDEEVLYSQVKGSTEIQVLTDVVRTLATRGSGLKLYITLFDLGAGGGTPWGQGSFEGMKVPGPPTRYPHGNPIGVPWLGHEGRAVFDDVLRRQVPFDTRGGRGDWDNYTLDPSSPYKRMFFRMLAGAVGRWLSENDSEELPLRAHIAGIELGNEIDVLHTRESESGEIYPDAVSWGRFYYYCASRLREHCAWVPLYLPALMGFSSGMSSKSAQWTAKLEFVEGVGREIQKGCMAYGGDAADLVAGIDNHFYHYGGTDSSPLLLAWTDTVMLRRALEGVALSEATVSMFETATDVLCEERSADLPACGSQVPGFEDACPPFVPKTVTATTAKTRTWRPPQYRALDVRGELRAYKVADQSPAYDFQGSSVVMRLTLAMAGGAWGLGWHTHIANHDAHFRATGLREDLVSTGCMPEWLQARKSWYALRRLVSVAGACTGARLIWPVVDAEEDVALRRFRGDVATGGLPDHDYVVVIELTNAAWPTMSSPRGRMGETGWRAYLAFIDPGAEVREGKSVITPAAARVTFEAAHARTEPTVYRVPLEPSGTTVGASSGGYPPQTWTHGSSERVEVYEVPGFSPGFAFHLDLGLGQWPVLVLTPTVFTVRVADGDVVPR